MPGGHKASALFQSSIMAPSPIPNYFACYGTDGAIHMPGSFLPERVEHFSPERGTWEEIPIPQRPIDALPHHENRSYRVWNQFFVSSWRTFKVRVSLATRPFVTVGWITRSSMWCSPGRAGLSYRRIQEIQPDPLSRPEGCRKGSPVRVIISALSRKCRVLWGI